MTTLVIPRYEAYEKFDTYTQAATKISKELDSAYTILVLDYTENTKKYLVCSELTKPAYIKT